MAGNFKFGIHLTKELSGDFLKEHKSGLFDWKSHDYDLKMCTKIPRLRAPIRVSTLTNTLDGKARSIGNVRANYRDLPCDINKKYVEVMVQL